MIKSKLSEINHKTDSLCFTPHSDFKHRDFVETIKNITSDEAKIINYLAVNSPISLKMLFILHESSSKFSQGFVVVNNIPLIDILSLEFPENIGVYIDNLTHFGVISSFEMNLQNSMQKITKDNLITSYPFLENRITNFPNTDGLYTAHTNIYCTDFGVNFFASIR
ncbi:Abi-alpha family protein [Dysgonomonas gadei]|uniref:Abi-alpha family protein n=1 Tax=Dysgonomonas gadei TaxID=156974 RepID=UPI0005C6920A